MKIKKYHIAYFGRCLNCCCSIEASKHEVTFEYKNVYVICPQCAKKVKMAKILKQSE